MPLDHFPQLSNTLLRCLLLDLGSIRVPTLYDSLAECALEVFQLSQQTRLHKVKETPQLSKIVLHWSSTENDSVVCLQLNDGFVDERLTVLYLLSLIKDNVEPLQAREETSFIAQELV